MSEDSIYATRFYSMQKQIDDKDKEIERLLNIMRPEKADYDYIELLFENKSKEEVIEALTYKCEQLENLYKCYEDKEIEARKKDNVITELEKFLERHIGEINLYREGKQYYLDVYGKLKELKGSDKE